MPSHLLFSSCAFFVYKIHKPITWLIVPTNYWIYEQHQPILSIQTHCSLFDSNILFSLPLTAVVVQIYSAFKKNKYSFFLRWSVWERINSLCVCFFSIIFRFVARFDAVVCTVRTAQGVITEIIAVKVSIRFAIKYGGAGGERREQTATEQTGTHTHRHLRTHSCFVYYSISLFDDYLLFFLFRCKLFVFVYSSHSLVLVNCYQQVGGGALMNFISSIRFHRLWPIQTKSVTQNYRRINTYIMIIIAQWIMQFWFDKRQANKRSRFPREKNYVCWLIKIQTRIEWALFVGSMRQLFSVLISHSIPFLFGYRHKLAHTMWYIVWRHLNMFDVELLDLFFIRLSSPHENCRCRHTHVSLLYAKPRSVFFFHWIPDHRNRVCVNFLFKIKFL